MNKIYFFCIVLFYPLKFFSQSIYPSGINGCIARWTFDTTEAAILTTIGDKSNNGNNALCFDVNSESGFRGSTNAAGRFNGISSWCNVNHQSNLNASEYTIISLVKFYDFNNGPCQGSQILSKGYPYFISGNFGQSLTDNPFDGDCNNFNPTHHQLCTQSGSSTPIFNPGNYISPNKWYFFTSVIKSDSLIQYQAEMDTVFKLTSLSPITEIGQNVSSIGNNTQNISIGKHLNPNFPYWLNGSLDELILFNRALSNSEVYSVYNYLWGYATNSNDIIYPIAEIQYKNQRISISTQEENYTLYIYDLSGQLIIKKGRNFKNISFDFAPSTNGIYLVRLVSQKNLSIARKIVSFE